MLGCLRSCQKNSNHFDHHLHEIFGLHSGTDYRTGPNFPNTSATNEERPGCHVTDRVSDLCRPPRAPQLHIPALCIPALTGACPRSHVFGLTPTAHPRPVPMPLHHPHAFWPSLVRPVTYVTHWGGRQVKRIGRGSGSGMYRASGT